MDSRHPNLEPYLNRRLQPASSSVANMSASYLSSLHHANQPPHPHHEFVAKPQRTNSVIVRNNASASATATTCSDNRSDFSDFPQDKQLSPSRLGGNPETFVSQPLQMSSTIKAGQNLQQDWLKQLQNLRKIQ